MQPKCFYNRLKSDGLHHFRTLSGQFVIGQRHTFACQSSVQKGQSTLCCWCGQILFFQWSVPGCIKDHCCKGAKGCRKSLVVIIALLWQGVLNASGSLFMAYSVEINTVGNSWGIIVIQPSSWTALFFLLQEFWYFLKQLSVKRISKEILQQLSGNKDSQLALDK